MMCNVINCCRNCTFETGRHPGCHSTCKKYLEERKNADEIAENARALKACDYSQYVQARKNQIARQTYHHKYTSHKTRSVQR